MQLLEWVVVLPAFLPPILLLELRTFGGPPGLFLPNSILLLGLLVVVPIFLPKII